MLILLLGLIYGQLDVILSHETLIDQWKNQFTLQNGVKFFTVFSLLTLINYSFEAYKWKVIMMPIERISYWQSMKGVFSGVLFSLFTPGRIGEFAGRIYFLPKNRKLDGIAVSLINSISQNLSIFFLGLIGMVGLIKLNFIHNQMIMSSATILAVTLLVIGLIGYFNIDLFIPIAKKFNWPKYLKRLIKKLKVLSLYDFGTLSYVLLLSLSRIAIWVMQYVLILYVLTGKGFDLKYICTILLIFLFQTGLPLPPISGLVARGGIAIYMWQLVGIPELFAVSATIILYTLNLLIPAIIGYVLIIIVRNK